jgi:5-methylcytosine-specific restriction endonuclease McrA
VRIPKTRSDEIFLAALEAVATRPAPRPTTPQRLVRRPKPRLIRSGRPAPQIIGTCGICGEPIFRCFKHPHSFSLSVDHILPLARGGSDALTNKQLAHLGCNSRKRDSLPGELPAARALRRRFSA